MVESAASTHSTGAITPAQLNSDAQQDQDDPLRPLHEPTLHVPISASARARV